MSEANRNIHKISLDSWHLAGDKHLVLAQPVFICRLWLLRVKWQFWGENAFPLIFFLLCVLHFCCAFLYIFSIYIHRERERERENCNSGWKILRAHVKIKACVCVCVCACVCVCVWGRESVRDWSRLTGPNKREHTFQASSFAIGHVFAPMPFFFMWQHPQKPLYLRFISTPKRLLYLTRFTPWLYTTIMKSQWKLY